MSENSDVRIIPQTKPKNMSFQREVASQIERENLRQIMVNFWNTKAKSVDPNNGSGLSMGWSFLEAPWLPGSSWNNPSRVLKNSGLKWSQSSDKDSRPSQTLHGKWGRNEDIFRWARTPHLPSCITPFFWGRYQKRGAGNERNGPGVLEASSQPQGVSEVRCRAPVLGSTQSNLEMKAEAVRWRSPGKEKWNQMISWFTGLVKHRF